RVFGPRAHAGRANHHHHHPTPPLSRGVFLLTSSRVHFVSFLEPSPTSPSSLYSKLHRLDSSDLHRTHLCLPSQQQQQEAAATGKRRKEVKKMENEFWQFSDKLRLETTSSFANLSIGDSIWADSYVTKDRRNFDAAAAGTAAPAPGIIGAGKLQFQPHPQPQQQQQSLKAPVFDLNLNGGGWKAAMGGGKSAFANGGGSFFNKEVGRPGNLINKDMNKPVNGFNQHPHRRNNDINDVGKGKGAGGGKRNNKNSNDKNNNDKAAADKRFKTLPASEALPRSEAIGGYIFVCNNDTMQENLRRQLFDQFLIKLHASSSVLSLIKAASFGGSNIDPAAWEDKKCHGESRFPAQLLLLRRPVFADPLLPPGIVRFQVRVMTRKICEPLEEDAFRPVLHHYDGPKFRLELSVPEALALLDIFTENNA
ncbi:hypothetical protein Taro_032009, partial [Colocasia esculenta]|nr:hypothetical protein [Colocasia esculenta]